MFQGQVTNFYDVEEITPCVPSHFQENSEQFGLDYDDMLT